MTNWTGIDPSAKERFTRATDIIYNAGAGNGSVLLQTYIDRVVQFLTLREMGMLAVMDRRQGSGPAAYVNQRTAGTTAGQWLADNGTGLATGDSNVGTYEQKSFLYKTLATRGEVSRKMQAIGQSYIDILAMEMAGKAEDFSEKLEEGLIYGTFGVGAGAEPMGLVTLLENANRSSASATANGDHIYNNAVGQTQASDLHAVYSLSLANLDEAIDGVKGSANRGDLVIFGSFAAIRQVNAALQAQQRFIDETEIAAGFRVRTYDGIPLVVSSAMKDTLKFDSDTTTKSGHISALTGGTGSQLFIVNKRHVFVGELTPTTVLPLAKTSSSTDAFEMYWDGAPVLANPFGMAILSNIAADGLAAANQ